MPVIFNNTSGENSRTRKLTEKQVRQIRQIYERGGRGNQYAAKFNISIGNFNKIGRRATWKNVA